MPFQTGGLAEMGLRPAGTSVSKSPLEQILEGAAASMTAYDKGKKEKAVKEKDKLDMYIALRNAGYGKEEAYEATLKPLGFMIPGDTPGEKKSAAELEKTEAETEQIRAKTKKLGSGRYDKAEDVPKTAGGLPLDKVKQDDDGKWYGEYKAGKDQEDLFDTGSETGGEGETPAAKAGGSSGRWKNLLATIISGSFGPAGMAIGDRMKSEVKLKKAEQEANKGKTIYDAETEAMIKANMDAYPNKSRDEIIAALVKKGVIK